ncbi:MAG: Txe/YoeB family addiction module toxin [Pseudomonadota bacterium]
MKVVFSEDGWDDYLHWCDHEPKIHARLNVLIEQCRRDPFKGLGKPEPLRGELKTWWSRRLTQEDRLVYRVFGSQPDQAIEILQCRSHY